MLLTICLGGTAVLASYAWGFLFRPDSMGALWGGVPEALRPLYTANMFLAAAGFFLFAPYLAFRLPAAAAARDLRPGPAWFRRMFLLVLVPSALWLPLTALMLDAPSLWLWWVVRVDLLLVAAGSLGIAVGLVQLGGEAAPGRRLALLGTVPFCVQTVLLDALIWPAFFPIP